MLFRSSINHQPAAVSYISPEQLNVQAPVSSLTSDQNVEVDVTTPDGTTSTTALELRISPAIFMLDSVHPAAVHTDGAVVGPVGFIPGVVSRPAVPGETILVYLTGLGINTMPPVPSGQTVVSPGTMVDPVTASIGGATVAVQYAGLVSPGLYQLNLLIPQGVNGDQPLLVQVWDNRGRTAPPSSQTQ